MINREIRCGHCGKLLCRGEVVELEIRCPRCHADNIVRAASPNLERHDRPQGRDHEAFFQDAATTLFRGDALGILRNLQDDSVDAVLTDPPYSSGGMTLSARQADPRVKYQHTRTVKTYPPMLGDNRDQRAFTFWATLWLTECWRTAREGSPLLLFTDCRQLPAMTDAVQSAGWLWRGIVVWHKGSGRPMVGEFRRDSEFVIYGCKGKLHRHTRKCLPGIYQYTVDHKKKNHLTSKPIGLVRELLEITPEGGTVLDPFAGGGTTALAASQTGRKSINIELSEEYARRTVERLTEERAA